MVDRVVCAGAELDELGGGFFVQGAVRHLHAEVAGEDGLIAFEEGPVEGGEGAGIFAGGALWVVLAVAAEVGHAIDVGGSGDVGLGGGDAAVGVGGHAEDVGFDDPIVGVDVAEPEPVGQLAGGEAAEGGEVREHHEPGDVVRPAFADDLIDDGIEAVEAGLDAPIGGGKRQRGSEGGWNGSRVGVILWRRDGGRCSEIRGRIAGVGVRAFDRWTIFGSGGTAFCSRSGNEL